MAPECVELIASVFTIDVPESEGDEPSTGRSRVKAVLFGAIGMVASD
jgi:hypothetical protein